MSERQSGGTRGKIAEFFIKHKGEAFTARQIAEQFDLGYKHAAAEVFVLFRKGVLARNGGMG